MHWIAEDFGEQAKCVGQAYIVAVAISDSLFVRHEKYLKHGPYLRTLPPPSSLRTPLYFNESEFALLKGTNMFGAATDRKAAWQAEWETCRTAISQLGLCQIYGDPFTW